MCIVSNIGDYWREKLPEQHPWTTPWIQPNPGVQPNPGISLSPTREEFEALKRDVEALKKLLEAAKKFDEETNQPHCEHEDKVALIKKVAELVGVDLKDVLS